MPRQFLSPAEREGLRHFPATISPQDLEVYFTLSAEDRAIISRQREQHTQLGFALQLCALRYMGFLPVDVTRAPNNATVYVGQQLNISPDVLHVYRGRAETRWEHLPLIMAHLGFRRLDAAAHEALEQWLVERALERDQPALLFRQACERLYQDKIVRPAVTPLERLVVAARQQAQHQTYQQVVTPLSQAERQSLNRLLLPDADLGVVPLVWLRREAVDYTATEILATLHKLNYVRQWPIDDWALPTLPPHRLKILASMAQHSGLQTLQRMIPERRLPALMAFLAQTRARLTDEAVDLFDRCFQQALRRSRQALKDYQHSVAEATQEKIRYFHDLAGIILDDQVDDGAVRTTIYQRVSPERLQAAFDDATRLIRPSHDHYLEFLGYRYSYLRQFTPLLLQTLVFRSSAGDDPLLAALNLLRQWNAQKVSVSLLTSQNVPLDFVSPRWRPYVLPVSGQVSRRYYELCILSALRDALRSGTVWVEGSEHYRELATYFIPQDRWPSLRVEFCQMVGLPANGEAYLRQRQLELKACCVQLEQQLPTDEHLRIEQGRLILSPLEADPQRSTAKQLAETLTPLLPRVQIAELFHEVDRWTGFIRSFDHASGRLVRHEHLQRLLYAAILAQACNIELVRMAELADLPYHDLLWCTTWYLRSETLQAATQVLVNYHYQQPLSQYWGDGSFSSSDGQRFPVATRSSQAAPLPRYFGLGRGLTFLTWTSDQSSQYGLRVTPPTLREATFVLDAILDNTSDLPLRTHTTDTGGSTDFLFALFDLLGLQFTPRLRDLGDYTLYQFESPEHYPHLRPLFNAHRLRFDLILNAWDDLLRLAASLKLGWATASLLLSRLQGFPRQHPLATALQEYGRLMRTLFILQYLQDVELRRRILVQLNKGEAVHRLRRFLMFGNLGQLRRSQPEQHLHQALCLHLLSNAVVVWNTVYLQLALDHLLAHDYPLAESDLTHLSPIRYEHINVYGKFLFDITSPLTDFGFRPLRSVPFS